MPMRKESLDAWQQVEAVLPLLGKDINRLFLSGDVGVSKTSVAFRHMTNRPIYKITVHRHLSPAEMIGFYQMVDGNFKWWSGPATQALKTPNALLLLDEIGELGDEAYSTMLAVLDDFSTLVIDLPTGERVRPAPGFCVIGTSNLPVSQLREAVADRFDVALFIPEPSPQAIEALGSDIGAYCKNLYANGQADLSAHQRRITYRRLATFKALREKLGKEVAAQVLFGKEQAEDFLNAIAVAQ